MVLKPVSRTIRSSIIGLAFAMCLALSGSSAGAWVQSSGAAPAQKGTDMTKHAKGTFEVKVIPNRRRIRPTAQRLAECPLTSNITEILKELRRARCSPPRRM